MWLFMNKPLKNRRDGVNNTWQKKGNMLKNHVTLAMLKVDSCLKDSQEGKSPTNLHCDLLEQDPTWRVWCTHKSFWESDPAWAQQLSVFKMNDSMYSETSSRCVSAYQNRRLPDLIQGDPRLMAWHAASCITSCLCTCNLFTCEVESWGVG